MILLANGCSFTQGYDLADSSLAWPSVLAKRTNYEIINLALGGASNARIFRTTLEYLNLEKINYAIIGWTFHDRAELTHASGMRLRMTSVSCLPDISEFKKDLSPVHKFWTTELHNRYVNYHSWLHHILHLQDYFASKKIKYHFFTAVGDDYLYKFLEDKNEALLLADEAWQWRDKSLYDPCREIHREYKELRSLVDRIDLNNWIGEAKYTMDTYLLRHGFKSDNTGHYMSDGHMAWANHLKDYVL